MAPRRKSPSKSSARKGYKLSVTFTGRYPSAHAARMAMATVRAGGPPARGLRLSKSHGGPAGAKGPKPRRTAAQRAATARMIAANLAAHHRKNTDGYGRLGDGQR